MRSWLPFRKTAASIPPEWPALPETPICVIGDVHGCIDALEMLLLEIEKHDPDGAARVLFLGDLLDRGPDSAAVLALVMALVSEAPERFLCLLGNHEAMALAALDSPRAMRRWLQHGGLDTVLSFAVPIDVQATEDADLEALSAALRTAFTPDLEAWLRGLPRLWHEGGWAASHAVGNPQAPLDAQDPEDLIWGHADSLRQARGDGVWMIHGHWIVPEVACAQGRIAVDTGAYHSGRLSAVWLGQDAQEIWQAEAGRAVTRHPLAA